MSSIYDWSRTPADNASADSDINWAEFMTPDQVNDSARQMMGRVAERISDLSAGRVSTGAANTYAVTSASTPTALVDGLEIGFVAHQTNVGASTLAVNSLGAIPLRSITGTALNRGEVQSGQIVVAKYRSASNEWLIVNGSPQLYALYSSLLSGSSFGLKVGDVKLSLSATVDAGFIRLTEVTQNLVKADYPELNAWASGQGYPWGSTSTTFGIPPAGGYFLRFGATGTSVDPDGARVAGSTTIDRLKSHTHTATASSSIVTKTFQYLSNVVQSVGSSTALSAVTTAPNTTVVSMDSHTHTITVASTGDSETAPKSVTMYADILARPALVANDLIGVVGYAYKWSTTTTDTDPSAGFLGIDNATPASATKLFISKTDAFGSSMAATLTDWMNGTSTVKGVIKWTKVGAPSTWISASLSGAPTDNSTYMTINLTPIGSNGTLSASDKLSVVFIPSGAAGVAGPNTGYAFKWSSTTTDANPTNGFIRANNASPASATYLYISKINRDSASVGTRILELGNSTNTDKGTIRIISLANPGSEANYTISGACIDATTYVQVPVSNGVMTGSFSANDELTLATFRNGDAGLNGTGSGTVTSVGLSVPSEFTVSGSPVTASGSLAFTKANQNANIVYAGPSTGSPAAPTFRALVNADLPSSGISPGTYRSITVNAQGIATGGGNPSAGSDGTYAQATVTISSGQVTSVTAGSAPTFQKFEYTGSAQTWTRPSGCRKIRYISLGAGGQGGGATLAAVGAGGGGGAGAEAEGWLDVTSISSLTITIGKGGSAGLVAQAGEDGGATSIANGVTNIVTCPGGKGGALGTSAATVALLLADGGAGGGPVTGAAGAFFTANYGAYGGYATRPVTNAAVSGGGANTRFGMGGRPITSTTTNVIGNNALGYGAGGGGCFQFNTTNASTHKGGNGTHGLVVIEEFY